MASTTSSSSSTRSRTRTPRADDLAEIRKARRRHATARARLAKAETDRDRVIREVYARGNIKHREIADALGVSFQRVSQILAKD